MGCPGLVGLPVVPDGAPLLTEKIVDGLVNPARGSRGNQQVGIAPRISCLGTPNGKIKN